MNQIKENLMSQGLNFVQKFKWWHFLLIYLFLNAFLLQSGLLFKIC
jgi:hypothetical protein